jgi:hypothetical protein
MTRFFFIILFLAFVFSCEAQDVKRTVFVPRQPTAPWIVSVDTAYNPDTKQTLVVWERHPGTHQGHSIWGRLMSATGRPVGPQFQLVAGPNPYYPSVIYDPFTKGFLFTFSNEITGVLYFEVYAQRLNANGRPAGAPVRVSSISDVGQPIQNDRPISALNTSDGSYAFFWLRTIVGSPAPAIAEGAYGAVLDRNLALITPPTLIRPLVKANSTILGPYPADTKYQASSNKFLLVTQQSGPDAPITGKPAATYLSFPLDSRLQNATAAPQIVNGVPANPFVASVNIIQLPGNISFLLFTDTNGIKKRSLTPQGILTGANTFAFSGALRTKKLSYPTISVGGTASAPFLMIVAVEDPFNIAGVSKIWSQQLSTAGKAIGPQFILDSGFSAALRANANPLPAIPQAQSLVVLYVDGNVFSTTSKGLISLNAKFPVQ